MSPKDQFVEEDVGNIQSYFLDILRDGILVQSLSDLEEDSVFFKSVNLWKFTFVCYKGCS